MKRKTLIAFLLVAAFFVTAALASWNEQTSGTTQDLNALGFASEALGFAAGANGTVLATANGGLTWEAKTSGTTEAFNDVLFPATAEAYFLGSSGTVLKTTDQGSSFTNVTFTGITGANYQQGAASGTTRLIAANMGTGSNGYLITSTDSGASWTSAATTNLEPAGVALGAGGEVFVWGRDYSSGNYVIWKNGSQVWSGVSAVNDLFLATSSVGYAVGASGLLLKTGNNGESWTALTGLTQDLNSLNFVTADFGWVVGENGSVSFTSDGGTSWVSYTLADPTVDIKDIAVRSAAGASAVAAAVVEKHVWISGSGGKIYKLASPDLFSFNPASGRQGWLGTFEVTGQNFMDGAAISFSGSGISVITTDFVSSSQLSAFIVISVEATVGTRDVTVTNPDATVITSAAAFSVTVNTTPVIIRSIRLDNNSYVSPE
ncbi:YCF48-related protein, partial [Candidatus Margulisiibacteriota bacterium]